MKITNTEVYGFEAALRGMRNPMNSWHLQDSVPYYCMPDILWDATLIGERDLDLAKRLIKAGNEHCKFLRQIQVWADFEMPLYWWSEFDTYKFNTKNSCSTMHKLFNAKKEIELDDFVYSKEDINTLNFVIRELNSLRKRYLETKDFNYVIRGKRLLPTSFKQKRTVNTNYAELINIYNQRKNHRLKEEWQDVFCKWCEELPYFKQFLEAR
jgi:RNase P subunit RPR2